MIEEYGFLESDFSAADAVSISVERSQMVAHHTGLYWLEFRAHDSGRSILCRREWNGQTVDITPNTFSVQSRVYEYGGLSWCLVDCKPSTEDSGLESVELFFVNSADQQIWWQSVNKQNQTQISVLTHEEDCRFGELNYDPIHQRILAIQEKLTSDPTQPEHSLVSIDVDTGKVQTLHTGADFYACPTLNAQSDLLAWITWSHPDMSWVNSTVTTAKLSSDGRVIAGSLEQPLDKSSGDVNESIQQLKFLDDNSLAYISDRSGWWNLYQFSFDKKETCPMWPLDAEFGAPQWQFGGTSWQFIKGANSDWIVSAFFQDGRGQLAIHTNSSIGSETSKTINLCTEYSLFSNVKTFNGKVYCIANSETRSQAILEIEPDFEEAAVVNVLVGNNPIKGISSISWPLSIQYPVAKGETAYGYLYMPVALAEPRSKPPLLVFTHGGPTSTTYPVFNSKIQFWTDRGFAVADLNYRGSGGFGKDYRHRLAGQWGITDVEDVVAVVDYLEQKDQVDKRNVFIRGGSAGGYTTLFALACSNHFRGGASYYGVSDPLSLAKDTHKFESYYLHWLIGDPESDVDLYQERSPLLAADKITCPMIFFQGGCDKVVVPSQTEQMVEALKTNGLSVDYHLYPEEQHGFRNSKNQISSLEAELAFYQSLLKE